MLANDGYRVGVAHNAGYDIGVLFPQPFPDGLKIELIGDDGAFLSARWDDVTIWDSMNLASDPLWKIGAVLGLYKYAPPWLDAWPSDTPYDVPVDAISKEEADAYDWDPVSLEDYAIRDADIVYELVRHFSRWAEEHGVSLAGRAATMSVNAWLMDTPYPVPRADLTEQMWGRAALYPGRAEIFQAGHHDSVETWDVNSMYPWAMTRGVPDPRGAWDSTDVRDVTDGAPGLVDATVWVPKDTLIPVLPWKYKDDVYYPTGTFRGLWTTTELQAARERGTDLVTFHGGRFYRRMIDPFTQFVESIYAERLDARKRGDTITEYFSKRILNSLWGRLALNPGGVRTVKRADTWTPTPCGKCRRCRQRQTCEQLRSMTRKGPYWLIGQYKGTPPDYINPTWAAWITATARLQLLRLMEIVGPDNLVRVHTDSVTMHKPDDPGQIHGSQTLGGLKLEYSGPIDIYAPNAILRNDGGRASGVPRDHAREYLETGQTTVLRPRGLVEGLATQDSSVWHQITIAGLHYTQTRADSGRRPLTVEEITGK